MHNAPNLTIDTAVGDLRRISQALAATPLEHADYDNAQGDAADLLKIADFLDTFIYIVGLNDLWLEDNDFPFSMSDLTPEDLNQISDRFCNTTSVEYASENLYNVIELWRTDRKRLGTAPNRDAG